jgi:tRNA (guanine37-N1)-methyltransferase
VRIDIITIFPEYFGPLEVSLIGKAASRGDITFGVHDLRTWTHDVHHTVDDSPFGGGPGMVMKPEPWGAAIDQVAPPGADPLLVVPTPAGLPFTQRRAVSYAAEPWLIFACGRYEGIDGRVADEARSRIRVEEISIGDYVLAGGEPAVLVMTEAVCRLLPGVLGNSESAADDSFGAGGEPGDWMAGLVEGPAFTRPRPGGATGAAVRRPRVDREMATRRRTAADGGQPPGPDLAAAGSRARPGSARRSPAAAR